MFRKLFISKAEKKERDERRSARLTFDQIVADKWVWQEGESMGTPLENAKGFFKAKTNIIGDIVLFSDAFRFTPNAEEMQALEARYKEAVRSSPQDAGLHNNLAFIFWKQGRLEEAKAEYRNAFELDPANAKLRNNLGFVLFNYGKRLQAEADSFTDPDRKMSLRNAASLFFTEAADQFQEAASLAPNYVGYQLHGALALFHGDQLDEAEKQFTLLKYLTNDRRTMLGCDEILKEIRQKRRTPNKIAE